MKADRPHDARFSRWPGPRPRARARRSGLSPSRDSDRGAGPGLATGIGVGAGRAASAFGRRTSRRRAVLAIPFPERWRAFLLDRYDHYDRLPDETRRAASRTTCSSSSTEKRITAIGVDVTDELRLLVAASAVTLSAGWPEYEWDQLTEVLLYPDDFDRDYALREATIGRARPTRGGR